MGVKQSKRSVDISSTPQKGAAGDAVVNGKAKEDETKAETVIDEKPTNGEVKETNGEVKKTEEVKEEVKEEETEKDTEEGEDDGAAADTTTGMLWCKYL